MMYIYQLRGHLQDTVFNNNKKKNPETLCVLAVHLHNNSVLGSWKLKLLGFKVQVSENDTIIAFV